MTGYRDAEDKHAHVVYRMYDAQGALLYIGVTSDLSRRLQMHLNRPAYKYAAIPGRAEIHARLHDFTVTQYPSRALANAAERAAITAEAPELNRHHNPSRFRWTRRGWVPTQEVAA